MSNFGDQQNPYGPAYPPPQQQRGSNTWLIVLVAVLGSVGIVVLACCGGAYLFVQQVKKGITETVVVTTREVLIDEVEESDLAADDQDQVIVQIERVADAYSAGDLEMEKAVNFLNSFSKNPLFSLGTLAKVQNEHLPRSGLTDDEKQQASLTIDRVTRGVLEVTIDGKKVKKIVARYLMGYSTDEYDVEDSADENQGAEEVKTTDETVVQGSGQESDEEAVQEEEKIERDEDEFGPDDEYMALELGLKDEITDDELRACLEKLKQLADNASVPGEPYDADLGAGFKRMVDEILRDTGH